MDGTAVHSTLRADGSAQQIFKSKAQARGRAANVYRLGIGDLFGFPITSKLSLGCRVLDVTDTSVGPIHRGVKVTCYRATTDNPVPNSLGVSISDNRLVGGPGSDTIRGGPGADRIVCGPGKDTVYADASDDTAPPPATSPTRSAIGSTTTARTTNATRARSRGSAGCSSEAGHVTV